MNKKAYRTLACLAFLHAGTAGTAAAQGNSPAARQADHTRGHAGVDDGAVGLFHRPRASIRSDRPTNRSTPPARLAWMEDVSDDQYNAH
jgi:hypothetical protein